MGHGRLAGGVFFAREEDFAGALLFGVGEYQRRRGDRWSERVARSVGIGALFFERAAMTVAARSSGVEGWCGAGWETSVACPE